MTDLDLAELRRNAALARLDPYAVIATGDEVLALIDHIETLEAALARVTDDSVARQIATLLYEYPPHASTLARDIAEVQSMIVRAIAASE